MKIFFLFKVSCWCDLAVQHFPLQGVKCKTERVVKSDNRGDMTEHVAEIKSRCVVNDACLAEHGNASAGSPKTSPEVFSSAIEFYVWSDEGINLYVDLNSSPLDWTERLKNEVYICESVYREECLHQNLCWFKGHKGIASSFQWNSPAGLIKDDYLRKEHSSSLDLMINKCTEIDQLDAADGSVISSAVMSHAINADASEHLDENQTIMSSGIDFDVQNQKLAGSQFCAAVDNCEKNINDALQKKANCDSVSGGLSSAATLEHRNSILESEICETSTLQNSCTILNLSVGYPGSSAAGSMDVQSSDIEERPKDISCTPYGGFSQRDSKNVTDYSLRTFAEKSDRNDLSVAMETSECSQFPDSDSLEKMLPVSDILKSNGAHKRKRKVIKNETKHRYNEPDRRVLRSGKDNAKQALPRRSRRLILKTVSS